MTAASSACVNEIDPLLNDLQPPRLVVYVPVDQARTDHALIELEAAGVVMQPGQQPPAQNTRLSIVFGTGNPQEVALAFLASDRHDVEVQKKGAPEELVGMLRSTFEADLPAAGSLADLRDRLAHHVLMSDLVAGLDESVPPALASIKVASSSAARDACVSLALTWRLRRDVRDSYVAAAMNVEPLIGRLSLESAELGGQLVPETFPCLERDLIQRVETRLLDRAIPDLLELAVSRQSRFWSEVTPKIQARWALVVAAAEVLLEADRVARASRTRRRPSPGLGRGLRRGRASLVPARHALPPSGGPVVQLRV